MAELGAGRVPPLPQWPESDIDECLRGQPGLIPVHAPLTAAGPKSTGKIPAIPQKIARDMRDASHCPKSSRDKTIADI
jgi:hypothetical protein